MNDFVLVTHWTIAAPIDAVWEALYDVRTWPRWWRYVKAVTDLEPGDQDGRGARRRFIWATRLPYHITFDMRSTRVERPLLLEARASGDLNGIGRWDLRVDGAVTRVRYDWRVSAGSPWIKPLTPLLRPVFVWNHNGLMRAGEDGLRQYLRRQQAASSESP
jgi:hypothetical protein